MPNFNRKNHRKRRIIQGSFRDNDLVIPVMGPTGAGKSTFINTAAGVNATHVGHDLKSCTTEIKSVAVVHPLDPNCRVVFVDTPGFDDTNIDDSQILQLIATWLEKEYGEGKKLAGIIYMHEISQARMFGSARKNLAMFAKLCGKNALKNVILASTKWDEVPKDVGERREQQLSETYWKSMLERGSRMARFKKTRQSAWETAGLIIGLDKIEVLLIQEELVILGRQLPETEAGKALRLTLQDLAKRLEKEIEALREIDEGHGEAAEQLVSVLKQIQELKITFSRRLQLWFSFKAARSGTVEIW